MRVTWTRRINLQRECVCVCERERERERVRKRAERNNRLSVFFFVFFTRLDVHLRHGLEVDAVRRARDRQIGVRLAVPVRRFDDEWIRVGIPCFWFFFWVKTVLGLRNCNCHKGLFPQKLSRCKKSHLARLFRPFDVKQQKQKPTMKSRCTQKKKEYDVEQARTRARAKQKRRKTFFPRKNAPCPRVLTALTISIFFLKKTEKQPTTNNNDDELKSKR